MTKSAQENSTGSMSFENIVHFINTDIEAKWNEICNLPNILEILRMPHIGRRINNVNFLVYAIINVRPYITLELLQWENVCAIAHSKNNEALREAAKNGHLTIIQALLRLKNVCDTAHTFNNMAFRLAVQNGHLAIVRELLQLKNVRTNAHAKDSEAICLAAANGHLEIVVELLQLNTVRANTYANIQALRFASQNGRLEIVQVLLKLRDVRTNASQALLLAVQKGRVAVALELLQLENVRANAHTCNNQALRSAAANGHLIIIQILLQLNNVRSIAHINSNEALRSAAANGHFEIVRELLKLDNVRANAQDQYLALCDAAKNGHLAIVRELLQLENVQTIAHIQHNQALHLAAQNGHFAIVKELLHLENVRINAHNRNNLALSAAANNNYADITLELLKLANVRNLFWRSYNWTHHQVQKMPEIMNYLMENKFFLQDPDVIMHDENHNKMRMLTIAYQATCENNPDKLKRVLPDNKSDPAYWYFKESEDIITLQQHLQSGQLTDAWPLLTQKYSLIQYQKLVNNFLIGLLMDMAWSIRMTPEAENNQADINNVIKNIYLLIASLCESDHERPEYQIAFAQLAGLSSRETSSRFFDLSKKENLIESVTQEQINNTNSMLEDQYQIARAYLIVGSHL